MNNVEFLKETLINAINYIITLPFNQSSDKKDSWIHYLESKLSCTMDELAELGIVIENDKVRLGNRLEKQNIQNLSKENPYMAFSQHLDLVGLSLGAEDFNVGYNELTYAVEKSWLVQWLNNESYNGYSAWTHTSLQEWLENDYDSTDSETILFAALKAGKVALIEFN